MSYDEESHFKDGRKIARQEKKRKSAGDRSKFKKSDQDKKQDALIDESLPLGRVLSVFSQEVVVSYQGEEKVLTIRGALKKERGRVKNLVTVGDFVRFQDDGLLVSVEPRRSLLSRREALTAHREQIIAANIDQVLITASLSAPHLNPPLIDRYIIAAKKGRMDPVILINKIDLIDGEEERLFHQAKEAYAQADIPLIALSVKTGVGMDLLIEQMKDKASVFSGQSGVGKSSLINAVTGLNLPIGETVKRTKKGGHTTTRAHLIPLKFGGFCIDTPGIRSFGVWDLRREELVGHFSEIAKVGQACYFSDCTHTHEKNCAVKAAVDEGEISSLRYQSFVALLETIDDKHLRR